QRLERQPSQRIRDAADRVRVLLKAGDFARARQLGDSLLRVAPMPTAGIAGVAVLLGRPTLAHRLLAAEDTAWLSGSADNQPVAMPRKAALAGLALLSYAAVGAPVDSIRAYERRIEDLLAGLPPPRRAATRSALLDRPAEMVFDVLGLRLAHRTDPPGPHQGMLLQWRLAHGDTALVRATLDSRSLVVGGSLATAERTLDAPLDSLTALHTMTLQYLPLAGCVVRMMALRAELAAARGARPAAQRWAGAVVTLWSGAEPPLRPVVTEMSKISQPGR